MFELDKFNSIASNFLTELRDRNIQLDSLRFRKNLERVGEILAYEISKSFSYEPNQTSTPLGIKETTLIKQYPVLVTILRAGLPFHQGFLNMFDRSDSAFIGASRSPEDENGSFEIISNYIASPSIEGRDVIIIDPMLATGRSIIAAIQHLEKCGNPSSIHIAAVIASTDGINYVKKCNPNSKIWVGSVDTMLNTKSYIIPGLGDAGDLAFGSKTEA